MRSQLARLSYDRRYRRAKDGIAGLSSRSENFSSKTLPPSFTDQERVNVHSQCERLNLVVGWTGLFLGLVVALWIGTWAFNGPFAPPTGFENYDSLSRRFLRLAHIAAVMLGVLNILFARELPKLELSQRWRSVASYLAALAWPGIALGCAVAAFVPIAKFMLPFGACSAVAACGIAAIGAWRSNNKENCHA